MIFSFLSISLLASAITVQGDLLNCAKAFPDSKLTARYNETIAHAVHSMTVEGLKLFSEKATEKNFVPTVNQDLSMPNTVLNHAPLDGIGHDFSTLTMNVIDKVLSTLGNSKDGLGMLALLSSLTLEGSKAPTTPVQLLKCV